VYREVQSGGQGVWVNSFVKERKMVLKETIAILLVVVGLSMLLIRGIALVVTMNPLWNIFVGILLLAGGVLLCMSGARTEAREDRKEKEKGT